MFGQGLAVNGSEILNYCQEYINFEDTGVDREDDRLGIGFCLGFAQGITSLEACSNPYFCLPEGVNTSQGIRVFVKFLKDNPDQLHLEASLLAAVAFAQAFPCAEGE